MTRQDVLNNGFKKGIQFTGIQFTGDTVFEVVEMNIKTDTVKYKVVKGGRIGQINTDLLQDLLYNITQSENFRMYIE